MQQSNKMLYCTDEENDILYTDLEPFQIGEQLLMKTEFTDKQSLKLHGALLPKEIQEIMNKQYNCLLTIKLFDDYDYITRVVQKSTKNIVAVDVDISNIFDTLSLVDINNYSVYCNEHYSKIVKSLNTYNKDKVKKLSIDDAMFHAYLKYRNPSILRDYLITKDNKYKIEKINTRVTLYYKIFNIMAIKNVEL